jgi:lipid A 3-O-deacylase
LQAANENGAKRKTAPFEGGAETMGKAGTEDTGKQSRRVLTGRAAKAAACALAATAFLAPKAALAQSAAGPWGLQMAAGAADHNMKKLDLGLSYDFGWSWALGDSWRFSIIPEAHVAFWRGNSNSQSGDTWEFGATPVFRIGRSVGLIRPFFEAGVGVRALSHPSIGEGNGYTMSSAFQFADMVGFGAQFGERQQWTLGFRGQHLSNAGFKRPNPGVNWGEIYGQWNF